MWLGYVDSRIHSGLIIILIFDSVPHILEICASFKIQQHSSWMATAHLSWCWFHVFMFLLFHLLYFLAYLFGSHLPEILSKDMGNITYVFYKCGRQLYTYFISLHCWWMACPQSVAQGPGNRQMRKENSLFQVTFLSWLVLGNSHFSLILTTIKQGGYYNFLLSLLSLWVWEADYIFFLYITANKHFLKVCPYTT